ncbi:MAG: LysR family transcriptional regulator, partial [Parvibaculaceae bacterium]
PAVSQQVRQLEARLGLPLIERVGRAAKPTAAGTELLTHIQRMDSCMADALAAMARHAAGGIGRVRIGTGATACIYFLPPVLRSLRKQLPSLEITVSTGSTTHFLKLIEDNAIDVGLLSLPVAGRTLAVTPIVEDELVAIASPDAPALPARVTPSVLGERPLVLYEPHNHTRRITDQWFARAGVAVKATMDLGNVEAIKQLVGTGRGYSILPAMAVATPKSRDGLVVRSLTPRLSRTLALVARRDKRTGNGLQEVIEALIAHGKAAWRGRSAGKSLEPG